MLIKADRIHNGESWLPQGSALEIDEQGAVVCLHDSESGKGKDAVQFEGTICPGFVNVHCHMELSHMQGYIPEGTGLIPFLKQIPTYRDTFTDEQKREARHAAYAAMVQQGIVAVGDICNTNDTLDVRALDKMHVHSFVESLGFAEERAELSMNYATKIYDHFAAQSAGSKLLRQSIVPHAPYSVSRALFRLINAHRPESLISIHNQESVEEHHFYLDKSGGVNELLEVLGIATDSFSATGKSSLQTYIEYFERHHSFIFVHNTYTPKEDADLGGGHFSKAWWCLCPNANLYIEGRLPDVEMLMSEGRNICIGTDSLASNHQLSVLAELQTIDKRYPEIGWETLLRWGTSAGAEALRMSEVVGRLKPGMTPGIVHIDPGGVARRFI